MIVLSMQAFCNFPQGTNTKVWNYNDPTMFQISCWAEKYLLSLSWLRFLCLISVSGNFSINDLSIIAMETSRNPTNHIATLLVNQKYITMLSMSSNGPEIVSCFALDSSTSCLPVVVPVSSLVQVKQCQSLVFCLFSSGTTSILWKVLTYTNCVSIN